MYVCIIVLRYGIPLAVNHMQTPAPTAPYRTATGLWTPGPAHGTHGIAWRPPQHPNPQLYNIPHFSDTVYLVRRR